jgi:hypothetical protein
VTYNSDLYGEDGVKTAIQSIAGACIFCGAGSLSKEHIWPTWSHSVLKELGVVDEGNVSIKSVGNRGKPEKFHKKERQGATYNKRLRVVCESCNNEWMSGIDEASKPVLIPLMTGQLGELDDVAQTQLALWATMKAMVAEQATKEDVVFTEQQRASFMKAREIPVGVTVWMGRTYSGLWLNAFLRSSAHLEFAAKGQIVRPDLPIERKNTQTTALGIGQLFLFVTVSNSRTFNLLDSISVENLLMQVWPIAHPKILLPLHRFLAENTATRIANLLNFRIDDGHRFGDVIQGEDYLLQSHKQL